MRISASICAFPVPLASLFPGGLGAGAQLDTVLGRAALLRRRARFALKIPG